MVRATFIIWGEGHLLRRRLAVLLVVTMLAALVPAMGAGAGGHLEVVYLDVGNGDTALFRGPCGDVGLVDANRGADDEVLAQLDAWNARDDLKWIAVSHYHVDHFGAVEAIGTATGIDLDAVYDRGGGATAADSQTYARYHSWVTTSGLRQPVQIGDRFDLCDTVTFDVVSVGTNGTAAGGVTVSDENDRSVCLAVSYGQFDLASCGDAHTRVENAVASAIGRVEVVKVSHHGSDTSSSPAYVTTLAPQVAIFTVGANSYGHPSPAVVDRWETVGATVFRTGNADGTPADGDITLTAHTDGTFTVVGDTGRTYTSGSTPVPTIPDAQPIGPACDDTTVGRFPDIAGVTHETAIECIGWWGVTAGNRDGTYEPSGTVTRDQMASFVARAIELTGGTLPTAPPNAFTDDNGNVHETSINRLAHAGVIGGVGGGRYNPGGTVNRAQMATFLARAWQASTGTPLPTGADFFADDNGNTHEANINRVAAAGLTGGTGAGYNPAGPVTRAQMATFLSRFMAKLVAEEHTDYPPADPQPLPTRPTPTPSPSPSPSPGPPPAADGPGSMPDGTFRNCTEAREAGAAPVHRGDPGYHSRLDRDGDGIGCE